MRDTPDAVFKIVLERYGSMTPAERCLAASSLYETARAIIESSLPSNLKPEKRRPAIVQRLYNGELPEEALNAHANYSAASQPRANGVDVLVLRAPPPPGLAPSR